MMDSNGMCIAEQVGGLRGMVSKRTAAIVQLLYLWTRDANVPVEKMEAYIEERWMPSKLMIYSDEERAIIARRAVEKML